MLRSQRCYRCEKHLCFLYFSFSKMRNSRILFTIKLCGEHFVCLVLFQREVPLQAGDWVEVEKYLSGFTKIDDNQDSIKIFYEIRKQKYLEALDRRDKAKALEILETDLKVFSTLNEEGYKELTQLLTLRNFR
ncbi:hypothetical protein Pint_19719 [Pistacia integerrima]|uniref:Uncharacterized protein n=1 Tax=Pistacia integerrima TaxID=434235 RepID=A0ACC0XA86_9ROSI|nr:hypothetical protein Pint_19719 [Pistacia integerrima]